MIRGRERYRMSYGYIINCDATVRWALRNNETFEERCRSKGLQIDILVDIVGWVLTELAQRAGVKLAEPWSVWVGGGHVTYIWPLPLSLTPGFRNSNEEFGKSFKKFQDFLGVTGEAQPFVREDWYPEEPQSLKEHPPPKCITERTLETFTERIQNGEIMFLDNNDVADMSSLTLEDSSNVPNNEALALPYPALTTFLPEP